MRIILTGFEPYENIEMVIKYPVPHLRVPFLDGKIPQVKMKILEFERIEYKIQYGKSFLEPEEPVIYEYRRTI